MVGAPLPRVKMVSTGGTICMMDAGAILAEDLKPRKARLLLMFALGETRDAKQLQEIFLNA